MPSVSVLTHTAHNSVPPNSAMRTLTLFLRLTRLGFLDTLKRDQEHLGRQPSERRRVGKLGSEASGQVGERRSGECLRVLAAAPVNICERLQFHISSVPLFSCLGSVPAETACVGPGWWRPLTPKAPSSSGAGGAPLQPSPP